MFLKYNRKQAFPLQDVAESEIEYSPSPKKGGECVMNRSLLRVLIVVVVLFVLLVITGYALIVKGDQGNEPVNARVKIDAKRTVIHPVTWAPMQPPKNGNPWVLPDQSIPRASLQ